MDWTTQVCLEAIKVLVGVYEQMDYIELLNHRTEQFKLHLIEMVTGGTELDVQVAVIQVLEVIDRHSLLEDEKAKVCGMTVLMKDL